MAQGGANAQAQQAQQAPQGFWNTVLSAIFRLAVMWFIMSYLRSGKEGQTPGSREGPSNAISPFVFQGSKLEMRVALLREDEPAKLLWTDPSLALADPLTEEVHSFKLTKEDFASVLESNKSLDLGVEFVYSADGESSGITFSKRFPLLRYIEIDPDKKGKSLLGGSKDGDAEEEAAVAAPPATGLPDPVQAVDGAESDVEVSSGSSTDGDEGSGGAAAAGGKRWVAHFKPNVTISMVTEFSKQYMDRMTPAWKHVDIDIPKLKYYPIVAVSDFWLLRDHLIMLNETVEEATLHVRLDTISSNWWQFLGSMAQAMQMYLDMGVMRDQDIDQLKKVVVEGNPYLLAVTFVASLLHSVFDFLAFKNDIGFWRNNKSMEGLSARTVIFNAVCQVIIFLYLLDNETSYMVIGSAAVGALIEFWKITRVMKVTVDAQPGKLPRIRFEDRGSYLSSNTKKYDDEAMRYMSYALMPCVLAYFIYSLIYHEYKSWYSFVVETLVGCIYAFGFILMCPQLYLNYKLKSVAHLPWRQMTYKFLNTIIDDLFAFVIKMPLLHRLSVFRDDLVFLVYLYQRWVYRVDKSRVNEFGYSDEPQEETEKADGNEKKTAEEVKAVMGEAADDAAADRHRGALDDGSVEPAVEGVDAADSGPVRRRPGAASKGDE